MMDPKQQAEFDGLKAEGAAKEGDYIAADDTGETTGQKPKIDSGEFMAMCFNLVFSAVATRRGDHWKLSEEELTGISGAAGDVMDKYFPDLDLGPEAMFLGASLVIFGPRMIKDKENEQKGAGDGNQSEHQSQE